MKQTFFAILFLLTIALAAHAQPGKEKLIKLYYNADWEVTTAARAAYLRLTYIPDTTTASLQSLFRFEGVVNDYYASGQQLAHGYYSARGERWGVWQFFYPNGKVECSGSYDQNRQTGKWQYWRQDGTPLQVLEFKEDQVRLLDFWNEAGGHTVTAGEGHSAYAIAAEQGEAWFKGAYKNGFREGTWQYTNAAGHLQLEELYEQGYVKEGFVYNEAGKRIDKYKKEERIIQYWGGHYLHALETRKIDTAAFKTAAHAYGYVQHVPVFTCPFLHYEQSNPSGPRAGYYVGSAATVARYQAYASDICFKADQEPRFAKGNTAMYNYFRKSLRQLNKTYAVKVAFTFVVNEMGAIEHVSYEGTLPAELAEPLTAAVAGMPRWKPGIKNGKEVATVCMVGFVLKP